MFNDIPSPTDVLHREAVFRLKVIEDFRALDRQLRTQEERITELTDELARRNTYIHELHLKRAEEGREIASARSDAEHFIFLTVEANDRASKAERRLAWWEGSLVGLVARPLIAIERALRPVPRTAKATLLPGDAFHYHLEPSPYRVFRDAAFTLAGWVAFQDGRPVEAVRARIGGHLFEPTPILSDNAGDVEKPGATRFSLQLEIPEGHHYLQLEARAMGNSEWRSFLNAPIWRTS